MISRLLLLGATGDLAGRFLLPALARMHAAGQLPDDLQVVGASHQDWDDARFLDHVAQRLREHAGDVAADVSRDLLGRLRYRVVDLAEPAGMAAAVRSLASADGSPDPPVAAYLALPPATFPAAIGALGEAGLPRGSRIAVEKPFGDDLASAVALNALLDRVTDAAADQTAFRVDHALGMPTVQDLLRLHRHGGPLAPLWNGNAVEQVDVLWEETLGLEGRADFYDRAGVVKDVLQNHMLQVLAMVAVDLPADPTETQFHDAKLDVLRSVRPLSPADVAASTRRGRYTAGRLAGGAAVPDYTVETGVDPTRDTETFAELVLELDQPRWAGTRFVLRAGKALAADRKGVLLHFREPVELPGSVRAGSARTGSVRTGSVHTDRAWIPLDAAHVAGPGPQPVALVEPPADGELAAYTAVLTDVLTGGTARSVSGEESEQAWRIVEPVLRSWAAGAAPLLEYPAGSPGPAKPDRTLSAELR